MQTDGGGGGHVEGFAAPRHGNGQGRIGQGQHGGPHALPFGTEDPGHRAAQVRIEEVALGPQAGGRRLTRVAYRTWRTPSTYDGAAATASSASTPSCGAAHLRFR